MFYSKRPEIGVLWERDALLLLTRPSFDRIITVFITVDRTSQKLFLSF